MSPEADPRPRRALITGVTGQDGTYLARLLLSHGWKVFGGIARAEFGVQLAPGLEAVSPLNLELTDESSIRSSVVECRPDAIFHLAALSHVPTTWDAPAATVDINTLGTLRLIEAMRQSAPEAHFVFAGSSDCYDHGSAPATGLTPHCRYQIANPYAGSKMAAMEIAWKMREAYDLRVSVAILMNHTSPRRPVQFVERKIVHEAAAVARGERPTMTLGSLETQRDWSWATDIVEGLRLMAERDRPGDFVLGSGELHSTGDWVDFAFTKLGLDKQRHLNVDPHLLHRADLPKTFGDIRPANEVLGWRPSVNFESMVQQLLDAEGHAGSPGEGTT